MTKVLVEERKENSKRSKLCEDEKLRKQTTMSNRRGSEIIGEFQN
jgi:hypothetical protein